MIDQFNIIQKRENSDVIKFFNLSTSLEDQDVANQTSGHNWYVNNIRKQLIKEYLLNENNSENDISLLTGPPPSISTVSQQ